MDFDIGLLFSVFVGCVGAVELISVVQYISDQLIFNKDREENKDKLQNDIEKIQENIRESISLIENDETKEINSMKDGVLYKDGFRQDDQPKDQELLDKYNKRMLEVSLGDTSEEPTNKIQENIRESIDETKEINSMEDGVLYKDGFRQDDQPKDQELLDKYNKRMLEVTLGDTSEESTKKIERTNLNEEPSSSNQSPINFEEGGEFSEDYLRSLDGVKNRPLVRDDGTGRRRAFKKRNSSSSISSEDSKAIREEELKMLTSMEEEQLSVKVKKHSKRHKRSPIKETKSRDDDTMSRSSLEDVDEIEGEDEVESPWGDINPEHHKSSEFLRGDSIVEEDSEDEELPKSETIVRTVRSSNLSGQNIPKLSSFEEATDSQHDEAIDILNKSDNFQKNKMEDKTNDKNVSSHDDKILIPALSDNQNETKSDVECFSHDFDDSSDLLLQKIEQEIDEKIIDWTGSSRNLNEDETDQKIQEFTNYIEKLNGSKPIAADMRDEINEPEQDFSYLPHIGNEDDFTFESDEEPFLDDGSVLRRIFDYSEEEDYDAIEGDISSDEEPYIKTVHKSKHRNLFDSDEEPSPKDMKIEVNVNVNVNVKMIKRRRKKVNKMEEEIETADDQVIIPELGTENDYIVYSDEEPKRDGFKEIFGGPSDSESEHEPKPLNSDEEQFFKTTRSITYRNTLDSDEEPSAKNMSIRYEHDCVPQTSRRCKRAIDMQEPLEYPEDHSQLEQIGTELQFVLDSDEEANFSREQSADKIQTQDEIDEEQFYSDRRPRDREDREIEYPEDFLIIQTIGNEDEFKLDLDEDPDREVKINWDKFSDVEEEADDGSKWTYKVYDSDEEPIFNHLRRNAVDMQEVLEFNEDYSYLPELGTENFYTMDSDEEPDRIKLPHSLKYRHVEEEHSKVEIKVHYESDEEPHFKDHKINHKNNDMNDHLDSDDDYSYLKNFVKDKSRDITDDEEPEYIRIKIGYAASSSREIEADTHRISHIVESDEEPFLKTSPELKIFKDDWDDDEISDVGSKNGEHSQTTQIYIQKRKEAAEITKEQDTEDNEYDEDDEDEDEFVEIIDDPATDHRRRRRLRKITAYLVYARRTPRIDHSDHSDQSETDDRSFVESSRSRSNTEEIREDMAEGGDEGTLDEENEENVWEDQENGYQKLPIDLDDEEKPDSSASFLHHELLVDSSINSKPSSSSSNFLENEIKSAIVDKAESPEFSGKNKKRHKKRKSIQINEDSSPEKEKEKKDESTSKRGSKKKKKDKKTKKSDDSCMDLLMDNEMFPFKQ